MNLAAVVQVRRAAEDGEIALHVTEHVHRAAEHGHVADRLPLLDGQAPTVVTVRSVPW